MNDDSSSAYIFTIQVGKGSSSQFLLAALEMRRTTSSSVMVEKASRLNGQQRPVNYLMLQMCRCLSAVAYLGFHKGVIKFLLATSACTMGDHTMLSNFFLWPKKTLLQKGVWPNVP